jgi:hypothetical protein
VLFYCRVNFNYHLKIEARVKKYVLLNWKIKIEEIIGAFIAEVLYFTMGNVLP